MLGRVNNPLPQSSADARRGRGAANCCEHRKAAGPVTALANRSARTAIVKCDRGRAPSRMPPATQGRGVGRKAAEAHGLPRKLPAGIGVVTFLPGFRSTLTRNWHPPAPRAPWLRQVQIRAEYTRKC